MIRKPFVLTTLFLAMTAVTSTSAIAADAPKSSVSVGIDMTSAPLYEGSSSYSVLPLPAVEVIGVTDNWGIFTASLPEGLRWDLPVSDVFGVALLSHYDVGRKEKIRTLNGKNTRLKGMGNLDGTMMAGIELSVNYDPFKGFIRGFKAVSDRDYGGEDLGHTGYIEAGVGSVFPLTQTVSMEVETYATWADREEMMSRFGVTRKQASRSQFNEHEVGGGLKSVSVEMGLNWQQSEHITFSGGAGLKAFTSSDVRDSPITEKNIDGSIYLSTMYTF